MTQTIVKTGALTKACNDAPYVSKNAWIVEQARGKRVLHLGCVGFADFATADRVSQYKSSLHYALTSVADVEGVDYSRTAIDFFRTNGIFDNVSYGDAERLSEVDIRGIFDVIVAGDIIEHLSNPGRMLEGLKRFCGHGTRVFITTPNAFGLPNFIRFLGNRFSEGAEHVMSFNAQNISNLLARHGYRVLRVRTCFQPHAASKRAFTVGRLFFERFPDLGGTLLVEAALTDEQSRPQHATTVSAASSDLACPP